MTRTVKLIERRTRAVRLPRGDVDFLLAYARHIIDITPSFERGTYRLTPRGCIGFLNGPTTRYEIGPKIPWPNLRLLLGLTPESSGETVEPERELLAVLATDFAEQLEAVTRPGLIAGYGEAEEVSSFLRGRLRAADQMRDAASRAFPDRFHIDEPVFDLNTAWNRIPRATATALLRLTALPLTLRQRVEAAALPLHDATVQPDDFSCAFAEPRVAHYRPLLEVCQLILNGIARTDPLGNSDNAFLVDLGAAFERYLTTAIERALAARRHWRVESQPTYAIGETALQPDIVLHHRGVPRVVLDAKWKTTSLDASDLHQVLAYATLTGATHVALVYPGERYGRTQFHTPDGRVRVSRVRVQVTGTTEDLARSVAKLVRQ